MLQGMIHEMSIGRRLSNGDVSWYIQWDGPYLNSYLNGDAHITSWDISRITLNYVMPMGGRSFKGISRGTLHLMLMGRHPFIGISYKSQHGLQGKVILR